MVLERCFQGQTEGRENRPVGMMDGHLGDGEALMEAEVEEQEVGQRGPQTEYVGPGSLPAVCCRWTRRRDPR